jgi:hypothetical protein
MVGALVVGLLFYAVCRCPELTAPLTVALAGAAVLEAMVTTVASATGRYAGAPGRGRGCGRPAHGRWLRRAAWRGRHAATPWELAAVPPTALFSESVRVHASPCRPLASP